MDMYGVVHHGIASALPILAVCSVVAARIESPPLTGSLAPPISVPGDGRVGVEAHPEPLSLLPDTSPDYAANKRLAFDMWRGIVNAGHVELADELLQEGYIQHSPVLPTGRAAFKQIFSTVPRQEQVPALVTPPLVTIFAEGKLVVMAMREELPLPDGEGTYTSTHFNLFRIEGHRLAEHWHSVQGEPGADLPLAGEGGPLPVIGATGEALLVLADAADPALRRNKVLVLDLWQAVRTGSRASAMSFLTGGYVEHNANGGAGTPDFRGFSDPRSGLAGAVVLDAPAVALVAQGDLVVLVTALEHADPRRAGATYTSTWFDMFRIAEGKIAEHWDAAIVPGTVVPFGR